MTTSPILEPKSTDSDSGDSRWMVVIFDNSFNTMDEVITVLMQATNCDFNEAYMEMWEAHHFGKASVHFGSKEVCDEVANVISEVGVETQVTQEWPEN